MNTSLAESASNYGNRRHRPAPVEYGFTSYGALFFTYADNSSLIVDGGGDLSKWLWNFRAENATRKDYTVAA